MPEDRRQVTDRLDMDSLATVSPVMDSLATVSRPAWANRAMRKLDSVNRASEVKLVTVN